MTKSSPGRQGGGEGRRAEGIRHRERSMCQDGMNGASFFSFLAREEVLWAACQENRVGGTATVRREIPFLRLCAQGHQHEAR